MSYQPYRYYVPINAKQIYILYYQYEESIIAQGKHRHIHNAQHILIGSIT